MKSTTIMAFGGAIFGIAVSWLLPLIAPETAEWAPTVGVVLGLLIICGASDPPEETQAQGEEGKKVEEVNDAIDDKDDTSGGGDDANHEKAE